MNIECINMLMSIGFEEYIPQFEGKFRRQTKVDFQCLVKMKIVIGVVQSFSPHPVYLR